MKDKKNCTLKRLKIVKILAFPADVSSYVILLLINRNNPKNSDDKPNNIERINSIEPTLKSSKKY